MSYTLEWLEHAVTLLNPARDDFTEPTADDSQAILSGARQETSTQKTVISDLAFSLCEKRKIRVVIRHYHSRLALLLDKTCEARTLGQALPGPFHLSCQALAGAITELLEFVENRFSDLIGSKGRVPDTYLKEIKKDLHGRIQAFELRLLKRTRSKALTDIVLHALYGFTTRSQDWNVTFRDVFYKRELVSQIEKAMCDVVKASLHDRLLERLIYLNFNSRAFINYYTGRVAREVGLKPSGQDRLDCLLLHYKQFYQMHSKPGVCLNPQYGSISVVIGKWFAAEISYLKSRMARDEDPADRWDSIEKGPKARVGLTVDQVAVAVRALVDIKILEVGSVSQAFRLLAPHLSTQKRKDISWDSMRRKAYEVEDSDRKVVVAMLEKAIGVVKSY